MPFATTSLEFNIKMTGVPLVERFDGELGMGTGQESHCSKGKTPSL